MSRPAGRPTGSPNRVICGAVRPNGSICRYSAGHGTNHKGHGNCSKHGGKSPAGRIFAGNKELNEAFSAADDLSPLYGNQREVGPNEALLEEVRRSAGMVQWIETRLGLKVPGQTEDYMEAMERRFLKERIQLTRVCQAALHAGVEERQVQIAEQWGSELAVLLKLILRDLDLTPAQQELAPGVVRQHMTVLEARVAS